MEPENLLPIINLLKLSWSFHERYVTILALTIAIPIVDFLSLHLTKLINNIHDHKFGQWYGIFGMVLVFLVFT